MTASAEGGHATVWDSPKPIDPNTTLLSELEKPPKQLTSEPKPTDKSYAWYYLEKGNSHWSSGDRTKALAFFKEAYRTPSAARVISGFRLVDALDEMGYVEEAIRIIDEMRDKYLVSTREFGEAKKRRIALEDKKRLSVTSPVPASKMLGKDWLYQVSTWRNQYTLRAMDELRKYEIPLQHPAYHYTFAMDEYFLQHPETPADDGAEILAKIVYQEDPSAREAIDRWRLDPSSLLAPHVAAQQKAIEGKITGADWVIMTQDNKMRYVQEAMGMLEKQGVIMQKTLYAYVYAVDELFTDKPELPAHDSVVALATVLYETEPEARRILEALRLES